LETRPEDKAMSQAPAATPLADFDYHQKTDSLFARIEAVVDGWLHDDVVDIDTRRSGGLLELVFCDGSRIVLNTQPPLHEVWLASRAGGYHYRYDGERWVDTKGGGEFFAVLAREASAHAGRALIF
jgi:CyaY protein